MMQAQTRHPILCIFIFNSRSVLVRTRACVCKCSSTYHRHVRRYHCVTVVWAHTGSRDGERKIGYLQKKKIRSGCVREVVHLLRNANANANADAEPSKQVLFSGGTDLFASFAPPPPQAVLFCPPSPRVCGPTENTAPRPYHIIPSSFVWPLPSLSPFSLFFVITFTRTCAQQQCTRSLYY